MNDESQLPYQRDQFYPRDRRSVRRARRFARWSLYYWGLAEWERADDLSLCVSELATNALVHGAPPGRRFLLRVRYDGDVVRVEVHDSGGGEPCVADVADEGGRGPVVVVTFAQRASAVRNSALIVWVQGGVTVLASAVRTSPVSGVGALAWSLQPALTPPM